MARMRIVAVLMALCLGLAACTLPGAGEENANGEGPNANDTGGNNPSDDGSLPPLNVDRVGVRTVDGKAEFYDTGTGERFVVRGVNYVELVETERGGFEDRVMATNRYDPEKVRNDFRHLKELGYTTVRIFFDTCGSGRYCIGNPDGEGLNPAFLDNMADLMRIAGEEGIYIIFTANSVPEEGQYWAYFDGQIYGGDQRFGFESYQNADWLHPAGVEIKRRFWRDLMSGLAEREAAFEVVLGWQLTNEYWLWKFVPPLSLEEGEVTISNGQTYEMSDPEQKRQMVVDGTLYFMEEIVPIIKQYDPEALTTMGFFAPQFPNETGIGGDWYVDTAPLLESAPLDFWDLHAYYDADLTIQEQAENFGIVGYEEKPVVMGETGAGPEFVPSPASALTVGVEWIADSCAWDFDGWLYWGYYPWPEGAGGEPWAALEDDELILQGMAPVNWPDACVLPDLEIANVAYKKPVRASRSTGTDRPENAVDGGAPSWNAGNYPPQWLEIDLEEPTTIQRVAMNTSQWPPGETRHRVWARLADGGLVLLGQLDGFTTVDMVLALDLPMPLPEVTAVRIETSKSPSWAGWREVEVLSAPASNTIPCLATAAGGAALYANPLTDETVGTLTAGQTVYLDGKFAGDEGTIWMRTGGGTWLQADQLTLPDECEVELAAPEARLVPVTFKVSVPEDTDGEVFIGGSFEGTEMPDWTPWTIVLKKQGGNVWTVTVPLPVGSEVEYVYNRGGWDKVERPESCGETNARRLVVEDLPEMAQEDTVIKWQDLNCE